MGKQISGNSITGNLLRKCRKLYEYCFCSWYPMAWIYNRLYCQKHKDCDTKKVELVSLETFCEENECQKEVLIKRGINKGHIYHKQYWNSHTNGEIEVYDVPEVFFAEFTDVFVFGGRSFLLKGSQLLEPNYTSESAKTFAWTNSVLKNQTGSKGIIRYIKEKEGILDHAFFLLGDDYSNYYHFLMEILPKFALCEKKKLYHGWPILVDAGLREIPSLQEALEVVNVNHHPIIWLKYDMRYPVRRLAYISPVTWTPIDMKHNLWPSNKDFVLCKEAMQCLKEIIVSSAVKLDVERIYVARYQTGRVRLKNDKAVAELCAEYGFRIIYPEKLNFIEQVAYFYSAKYIMACGGGGCTNAIFCNTETEMYVVAPREHNSLLWPTVLGNAGVKLRMIDAKIVKKRRFAAGDEFKVDLREVREILESL